jgi:hypothetical protein
LAQQVRNSPELNDHLLRWQGWVTITTLDHRLICLCGSCKAEFPHDPWQLHEISEPV